MRMLTKPNKPVSIKDLPVLERPREKLLLKSPAALSDEELMAVILGKGTQKISVMELSKKIIRLIDHNGENLEAKDFTALEGIGTARAALVLAAFEFVRRRIKPGGIRIDLPGSVYPLISHYGDRKQEHFLSISLNGANEVLSIQVVTIGLINKCLIHPREVFAGAIEERAAAIIVSHNHPSGNLTPSQEDKAVTKRLKNAGEILGIPLLDHIIFNSRSYYSFVENSFL